VRYDERQPTTFTEQAEIEFLMPSLLNMTLTPSIESNETVIFPQQPEFKVFTADGQLCDNLGFGSPWYIEASLDSFAGDVSAQLLGSTRIAFVNGTANFTDLAISHSGNDYTITYRIVQPITNQITSPPPTSTHNIKERVLAANFNYNMSLTFESAPLHPQPKVQVIDEADGSIVATGWKNRTWHFKAELFQNNTSNPELVYGANETIIDNGIGQFLNLSVLEPGVGYQLRFSVITVPSSSYEFENTTDHFNVSERQFNVMLFNVIGDCNDTVICGNQPIIQIRNHHPDSNAANLDGIWTVTAYTCSKEQPQVQGTNQIVIDNSTGRVRFTDLHFDQPNKNLTLCFNVSVNQDEPRYANLQTSSNAFDVNSRFLCLNETTRVDCAKEGMMFGQQPVLYVIDCATGDLALNITEIQVIVSLNVSPETNQILSGTTTVTSVESVVQFTDLIIDVHGVNLTFSYSSPSLFVNVSTDFVLRMLFQLNECECRVRMNRISYFLVLFPLSSYSVVFLELIIFF